MKKRLVILREMMRKQSLEAVIFTCPANSLYLSGFSGSSGCLIVDRHAAFLVTDFRYTEQAREQAPHYRVVTWREDFVKTLAGLVADRGWGMLCFEKKDITYDLYQRLYGALPAKLVPVDGLAEEMRMVKDPGEIDILMRGARCLDQAFTHILSLMEPGITEQEISMELEFYLRRLGASGASFPFIVASGERGAMPHGIATDKELSRGDLVTMDFGAVFDSYATDMTRTVCLGEPDSRQREIYEIVRQAQEAAVLGIRPGMTGREADFLARQVIVEAGYGENFGHGLGHGVGLGTHELPTLSPRSEKALAPGMVVTAEPGIYIPGWGGVRIEDMLLVTEDGVSRMTSSSRDLISI